MLKKWNDINNEAWSLLIGNGFSINLDRNFSYKSLFNSSQNLISQESINVFNVFKTTNFEDVMSRYQHSAAISEIYQKNNFSDILLEEQDSIRSALIKAIQHIHPPFSDLANYGSLEKISDELKSYYKVFTTNYDLIPYWSMRSKNKSKFKDFFWHPNNNYFDFQNSEIRDPDHTTQIYYLHGALHIFEDDYNDTYKMKSSTEGNILSEVYRRIRNDRLPVFISEGSWREKYRKIKRSDYLIFCYENLKISEEDLVIIGHSMTEDFDNHIISAIQTQPRKKIAFGIHRQTTPNVHLEKERIKHLFSKHHLEFFDSQTHPLGGEGLSPYAYP